MSSKDFVFLKNDLNELYTIAHSDGKTYRLTIKDSEVVNNDLEHVKIYSIYSSKGIKATPENIAKYNEKSVLYSPNQIEEVIRMGWFFPSEVFVRSFNTLDEAKEFILSALYPEEYKKYKEPEQVKVASVKAPDVVVIPQVQDPIVVSKDFLETPKPEPEKLDDSLEWFGVKVPPNLIKKLSGTTQSELERLKAERFFVQNATIPVSAEDFDEDVEASQEMQMDQFKATEETPTSQETNIPVEDPQKSVSGVPISKPGDNNGELPMMQRKPESVNQSVPVQPKPIPAAQSQPNKKSDGPAKPILLKPKNQLNIPLPEDTNQKPKFIAGGKSIQPDHRPVQVDTTPTLADLISQTS